MAGSYNAPDWLSPAAKDLLARMLTVDPERRITLAEVAAHPWTRGSGPAWEMPTVNCYSAPPVIQGASGAGEAARAL
jgi:serine/threonine protein kinase